MQAYGITLLRIITARVVYLQTEREVSLTSYLYTMANLIQSSCKQMIAYIDDLTAKLASLNFA